MIFYLPLSFATNFISDKLMIDNVNGLDLTPLSILANNYDERSNMEIQDMEYSSDLEEEAAYNSKRDDIKSIDLYISIFKTMTKAWDREIEAAVKGNGSTVMILSDEDKKLSS